VNDAAKTLYDVRDGAGWITLNAPENRNALSAEIVDGLQSHMKDALGDDAVRCIVITGSGPAFCAGADLKAAPPKVPAAKSDRSPFVDILDMMWNGPKPVIAAVNGAAFGGGLGLVGAADIVIASDAAKFSFSEVRIGVAPAIISVVCLRKLGRHHGMRLFLTGARFDANQALEYGLVHQVSTAEGLAAAVQEQVDAIRAGGPNAVAEAKIMVRTVPDMSMDDGFNVMAKLSAELFNSEEAAEGMASFREKRKAKWITG
jgi:methylglutaconyl-CoA hydratase